KMKAESETLKFTYKEILKTSYPMALSTLTFFLMQSTDVILLGKFDVFENVAFYSTAIKISMLTSIALMSVNVITAPKISEEYSRGNHAALAEILKKSSRLIFMLSVPFLLFLILFSKFLLSLFGEEYQAAQIPLLVLLIGQFFNSLTGPTGTYMNMTGKQKILHRFLMGAFLVNFILNYTLIPLYGMTGSAIATSISVAGWNILAALFVYKKDSVKTFLS
ncbi:MAG TPA: MATE family efflux transporter, partial [Vicingaceae bacterium]|nr:MATE family efflux transporter [Vicingaceae bacterium]